jgi:hypothetical protein
LAFGEELFDLFEVGAVFFEAALFGEFFVQGHWCFLGPDLACGVGGVWDGRWDVVEFKGELDAKYSAWDFGDGRRAL